ncbi:MAG: MlaE family ABC transporter permease [Gemmatimonadota bacterium]
MSSATPGPAPIAFANETLKGWAFHTQEYIGLLGRTLRACVSRPFYFRDLTIQMDVIGVGSIMIVLLTGLFTGMVLALQSAVEMEQFGAEIYIGRLVGASVVRELGPVLTALMVTGRAGSGMAAAIGAMVVTEQVDALYTIGVDPVRKLVVPRFLAGLIMLPILTMITDVVAVFGGLIIALFKIGLTFDLYMRSVYLTLAETGFILRYIPIDLISGLLKPIWFGAIMALTGSYYGLSTTGGTEGVGRATTRAVVTASVLILAFDYFLTQILIVLLIE